MRSSSTSTPHSAMKKRFIIIVGVIVGLIAVSAILWKDHEHPAANGLATTRDKPRSAVATAAPSSFNALKAIGDGHLTYWPHTPRVLKEQLNLPSADPRKTFLLARSPEDAAWLDKYGFPTSIDETRLEKMSDEELISANREGDRNAYVHLHIRQMQKAYDNPGTDLPLFTGQYLVNNPYMAYKVVIEAEALLKQFNALSYAPEVRTAERVAIASKLATVYEDAGAMLSLHDTAHERKIYTDRLLAKIFPVSGDYIQTSASDLMAGIANYAMNNGVNGQPGEQVISPRPALRRDISGQIPKTYYVRE